MKRLIILLNLLLVLPLNGYADTISDILDGAYAEIRNETQYNAEMLAKYFAPTFKDGKDTGRAVYPGGDVNPNEGICADLIVRALRNAGIDIQKLVHLDILSHKAAYGVKIPDKYSDHRRVWILKTFFLRNWKTLSTRLDKPVSWQPGDVVIWDIGSKGHLHIGIIGKKKRGDGLPYVIHNMRYVPFVFTGKTTEQDVLEGPDILGKWTVIGHFRYR